MGGNTNCWFPRFDCHIALVLCRRNQLADSQKRRCGPRWFRQDGRYNQTTQIMRSEVKTALGSPLTTTENNAESSQKPRRWQNTARTVIITGDRVSVSSHEKRRDYTLSNRSNTSDHELIAFDCSKLVFFETKMSRKRSPAIMLEDTNCALLGA
jgi:hypothetical protein